VIWTNLSVAELVDSTCLTAAWRYGHQVRFAEIDSHPPLHTNVVLTT
jgi:hypothetical protein